jgi:hypothetical protein
LNPISRGARSGWVTVQSETCFVTSRQQPQVSQLVLAVPHIERVLNSWRCRVAGRCADAPRGQVCPRRRAVWLRPCGVAQAVRCGSGRATAVQPVALPGPDAGPRQRRGHEAGAARPGPAKDGDEEDRAGDVARCSHLPISVDSCGAATGQPGASPPAPASCPGPVRPHAWPDCSAPDGRRAKAIFMILVDNDHPQREPIMTDAQDPARRMASRADGL